MPFQMYSAKWWTPSNFYSTGRLPIPRKPRAWRASPAIAFYKYKDAVYPYQDKGANKLITVHAVLQDKPGVLMALISAFYDAGANILTVNQNIPVMGVALVSISARVDGVRMSTDSLLASLGTIEGVQRIENITGE